MDHQHTLVVRRPSQILDGASEGLQLNLADVLFIHSIPNPNFTRLICDIEKQVSARNSSKDI